jgi:DNA-binding NarL/FixJ family response regulator
LNQPSTIRVILADDHNLVRQGIRSLLDKAGDIEVVGEASDGQEALGLVAKLEPDVLVADVAMPRMDGLQAVERIRSLQGGTRTVVLSMYADETLVRQALRNGASGYVLKDAVTDELLLAIRAAHRGDLYLSPGISRVLVNDLLAAEGEERLPTRFEQLTPREREVLQRVAEGHTNAAMAQQLQISVKTVEKHRSNLMAKLDVHDLPGLMRVAIRHGLVFLEP